MDRAVAKKNQRISLFYGKTELINLFILNYPCVPGDLDYFPVPDKNTAGIIIFHQVSLSVIKYLEDGKCGVGHLPDLTDGQRLHDGFDALFQSGAV